MPRPATCTYQGTDADGALSASPLPQGRRVRAPSARCTCGRLCWVSDTPDEVNLAALFQRYAATREPLDRWRARSRTVESPQPGSDLAGDIPASPGIPSHELARHALVSATQHLNLARTAIEASDLYPIAHNSVLRGALVGSSRAVWMLWPDDPLERQQRALRVGYESHRRFRQYAEAAGLELHGVAVLDQVAAETRSAWRETATLKANETVGDGAMIAAAAAQLFADDPRREKVAAMWMQGSGDAHGVPWPAMSRPASRPLEQGWVPGYPRKMVSVALPGDLASFVDDYELVFTITRRGWSLFDQRCTGP